MLTVKSEHYWAQFLAQVKASPAPLNLQWERKTLACGRWSGSNRPTGIAWFQAWSLVFVVTAVLFWAQYMIRVTLSSKQKYRFLELFRVIFLSSPGPHFSLDPRIWAVCWNGRFCFCFSLSLSLDKYTWGVKFFSWIEAQSLSVL